MRNLESQWIGHTIEIRFDAKTDLFVYVERMDGRIVKIETTTQHDLLSASKVAYSTAKLYGAKLIGVASDMMDLWKGHIQGV